MYAIRSYYDSIIGTRAPVYCTSLGRALLFDSTDDELKEFFGKIKMNKKTAETVIDSDTLIAKIRQYSDRGWSEEAGEHQAGVRCAGAPVYDYRNRIAAAISTAWNIKRTEIDPDEIGLMVKETAESISKLLGSI